MQPGKRILSILTFVLLLCGVASADDFFTTSPGPLATSHASLDSQDHCNDCHVDGSRTVSEAM